MLKYMLFLQVFRLDNFCKNYLKVLFKNLNIYDKSNKIVIVKRNGKKVYKKRIKNIKIVFNGKNNYVEIHEPFRIKKINCKFVGDNNTFILNKHSNINQSLNLAFENNNILNIGEYFSVQRMVITYRNAINTKVIIGKNCMFSYEVQIRTGDGHTIYDKQTKEIINNPKDVEIGNRVWIAAGTKVLKGSKIPANSIIGANSIVTRRFDEENCILAGIPAKVVKTGVNWHKCGPQDWDSYKNFV